jgi:hypothetical protein
MQAKMKGRHEIKWRTVVTTALALMWIQRDILFAS